MNLPENNSAPIDPLLVETELADYCISELDSSRVASQIPGADLALTNYVLDGASNKDDLILGKRENWYILTWAHYRTRRGASGWAYSHSKGSSQSGSRLIFP